jgi:hypothetical protein
MIDDGPAELVVLAGYAASAEEAASAGIAAAPAYNHSPETALWQMVDN